MKLTAKQLRRIIKEEVSLVKSDDPNRFLHGAKSGHAMDDEGRMVKSRMASLKKMAAEICELLNSDDQLPGWVQDLVATSHGDIQHVYDYMMGNETMRNKNMPQQSMMPVPMATEGKKRRKLAEAHSRITAAEIEAWKNGDWGFVEEAVHGMMPGRDDKFMHPTTPPRAPTCYDCGNKLTVADKDAYEAEGGVGYPEVCEKCAELS